MRVNRNHLYSHPKLYTVLGKILGGCNDIIVRNQMIIMVKGYCDREFRLEGHLARPQTHALGHCPAVNPSYDLLSHQRSRRNDHGWFNSIENIWAFLKHPIEERVEKRITKKKELSQGISVNVVEVEGEKLSDSALFFTVHSVKKHLSTYIEGPRTK